MAKLPGWLRVEGITISDGTITYTARIRWWHPGFWAGMFKIAVYRFANRWLIRDCGHFCRWTYPYGFVPEACCPIHDPGPD